MKRGSSRLPGCALDPDKAEEINPNIYSTQSNIPIVYLCKGSSFVRLARSWFVLSACFCIFSCTLSTAEAQEDKIIVTTQIVQSINPEIYGVNYDWNVVADQEYGSYNAELRDVTHFTLQRFPAGWDAEWYDWDSNRTPGWKKSPADPGADAATVMATSPAVSIVTPSKDTVKDPERVGSDVDKTLNIVRKFGDRAAAWEIGNEWWLQSGAKQNPTVRKQNLQSYSRLVTAVVPQIMALQPGAKIFVTGDWQQPEEIGAIRSIVGEPLWGQVRGIAVHIYCGTVNPETNCKRVPDQLAKVQAVSGKSEIYASEWNVPRRLTHNNFGMPHANEIGIAIGILVRSGVDLAAYWPPVRILPSLALISSDFQRPEATGLLFGWLAEGFRGSMVETRGALPSIAAVEDGKVGVFVFSRDQNRHSVSVALPTTSCRRKVTGSVMYAASADGSGEPRVADLALGIVGERTRCYVTFVLNPGTSNRGSGWEIARISVAP